MKYTTTKPTACGYYWMRSGRFEPEIVLIYVIRIGRLGVRVMHSSIFKNDFDLSTAHPSIEWAGPIPKPEEKDNAN